MLILLSYPQKLVDRSFINSQKLWYHLIVEIVSILLPPPNVRRPHLDPTCCDNKTIRTPVWTFLES